MTEDLPSNWGRWGDADQLGALNRIDDAARLRAADEVRTGSTVSLARRTDPTPLTTGLGPVSGVGATPGPVMQVVNFNGVDPLAVTDSLLVNTHNAALTHIDALVHIPVDGLVYPGVPLRDAVTPTGVRHGGADGFTSGITTRGVLLDLAPGGGQVPAERRIGAADLDAALSRAGTSVHEGDAVVVRGGWDTNRPMTDSVPGLDLDAVEWLDERGAALSIGDVGDPRPVALPMPMHHVAMARLGIPLVDAAELTDLAERCAELGRWSFMLVLAPPRISGTTGLVVNPLAVF